MRKLRNNNETSRKFLLSFLLKKRNLTSEIYRTFAERDLATVSQSLYKQFIILWFEIIESLPSTEIEQVNVLCSKRALI